VFQFSDNRIASDADKGNPRNTKAFKRDISPHAIGRFFVLSTLTNSTHFIITSFNRTQVVNQQHKKYT